LSAKIIIKFQV